MTNLLESYIHSLIHNINTPIHKEYNLVVDGGAFNCAFSGGCLYYINELEKLKLIKINKISGCSIGALLGYMYLTNTLHLLPIYYNCLLSYGRKNINFNIIKKLIINHVKQTDYTVINKKLFITFNNINTLKHHVVSEYNSEKEVIKCLIKSCFIPYMIDGQIGFKDKKQLFCDGFTPHIFKNDGYCIFISLITVKLFKHSFYTSKDIYIWDKLFYGIKDMHLFFITDMKETRYCSLINKWNYNKFIEFTIREIVNKIIVALLLQFLIFKKSNQSNIVLYLKNNIYFKESISVCKLFLNNIISYKVL